MRHREPTCMRVSVALALLPTLRPLPSRTCCADERLQFIRLLQRFSERQNLRVSILSGDAHVGGVGRLYSRPKIKPLG